MDSKPILGVKPWDSNGLVSTLLTSFNISLIKVAENQQKKEKLFAWKIFILNARLCFSLCSCPSLAALGLFPAEEFDNAQT